MPATPDGRRNISQSWEWFDTHDQSALLRTEFDLDKNLTAFADLGGGSTRVDRLFGNPTLLNLAGDTRTVPQRFKFDVDRATANLGLRARLETGPLRHALTFQLSEYRDRLGRASANGAAVASNIYSPVERPSQDVAAPAVTPKVSDTKLSSVALADTVSTRDGAWQLTLGVRNQQVRSDNFSASGATTASYDRSAVTPMAGLVVKPWRNVSLYANYIEGLTKGDAAPAAALNAGEIFAPYRSKQQEVGAKFDAGRMIATLSLFQVRKPGGQLSGGVFSVDGEQRNRGVELGVSGEASRNLRLLGGVTVIDAELTRTNSAATQGKTAPGVPSVQANLGAEWDTSWAPGVTLSGNVTHTSKQYVDRANTLSVPAWTTLDLGARYRTKLAGKSTIFRADIRNLFDRRYWAGVSQFGALAQGAPRTLLLSMTTDF